MRNALILFLLLFFTPRLKAQAKFNFGISYSPTAAFIDDFSNKTHNHRYRQQACIQLKWKSGKHFSYVAGLGYSFIQAEYSSEFPSINETFITWFRHSDILLPLQLQYSFSSKPSRIFFTGGLIPSINVGRNVQETRTYSYSSSSSSLDATDEQGYRILDAFITLGMGYEYKTKGAGTFYIQPNFRTNFLTELLYVPKYLFSNKPKEVYPPLVSTFGIELGYFLK